MNILLLSVLRSLLPFIESRYAIPIAIAEGVHPLIAYLFCVIPNIAIIPLVFLFLDYIHEDLLGKKLYSKISNFIIKRVSSRKDHVEKKMASLGFLALTLFVAIPLPVTGAYTGMLICWLLNLNREKSMLAIAIGVLLAGFIATIATIGIKKILTGI